MQKKIIIIMALAFTILGGSAIAQPIAHPYAAIDDINKRDKVRFEQEQKDRREYKQQKAEAEERARDRQRESACAHAKNARKAYVKRIRSKATY
jgi:hypothetical protein